MRNSLIKVCREYKGFALFIVLMIMFRSALADWNVVPTSSMKPTILEGDRILVNKLAYDFKLPLTHISVYKFADPKRGDIVVFDSKLADSRLVKRVIGLPGDIVEMKDNRLIINGIEARYSNVEYAADALLAIESYDGMKSAVVGCLSEGVCHLGAPTTSWPFTFAWALVFLFAVRYSRDSGEKLHTRDNRSGACVREEQSCDFSRKATAESTTLRIAAWRKAIF